MIPRLQTWIEGVTLDPLMVNEKDWKEWIRDFGPRISVSDLLKLTEVFLHT